MADEKVAADEMHESTGATTVVVTIPADPARLPVLRSVAAALSVSLDFDIDTMADLRMAVDELTTAAVTRAKAGSQVTVDFVAGDGAVTVRALASTADPTPVDEGSFGWMVLTTLAESVSGSVDDPDGTGPQLRLSMTVRPGRAVR